MNRKDRWGILRPGLLLIGFTFLLLAVYKKPTTLYGAIGACWRICSPVVYGFCMAFVMNVCLRFLEGLFTQITRGKLKGKLLRAVSLFLTAVVLLGALALAILVLVPAVGDTVSELVQYLPKSVDGISDWLVQKLTYLGLSKGFIDTIVTQVNDLVQQLIKFLETDLMSMANIALNVTTSVLDVVINAVLGLVFAVYILACKEKIGRFTVDVMRRFLRKKWCDRVVDVCHLSFESFSCFVKGQLLEACILAMLCFIGMVIFRFPNAVIISLFIGVTALIPIFGAWIGGAVSAFLILVVSPIKALLFIVFILVLQEIEGNLIYPRVVGSSLGLPGIIVLGAVTIGGNIAGVTGMLLGVPLCAVLYTLLRRSVYREDGSVREREG